MNKQEVSGFSAYEDGHIVCHCARCQMEQTEVDMQTAYSKKLQKRNAELQEAIDKVVDTERHPPQGRLPLAPVPRHYLAMRAAIRKHLSPLVTIESSLDSS